MKIKLPATHEIEINLPCFRKVGIDINNPMAIAYIKNEDEIYHLSLDGKQFQLNTWLLNSYFKEDSAPATKEEFQTAIARHQDILTNLEKSI